MDLDLRKAIVAKNADNDPEELEGVIADAIQSGEEKMLPGLGVFFEIVWKHADDQVKQGILENLADGMPDQ
jgi:small acid-soluble spore protein I (minor)